MYTRTQRLAGIGLICAVGLTAPLGCRTTAPSAPPVASGVSQPVSLKRADVVAQIEKKERKDEFDSMVLVTDLDGAALGAFMAATERRLATLAEWEASPKGQEMAQTRQALAAARTAMDAARASELEARLAPLSEEYGKLRRTVRADVMSTMSLEQQRTWTGSAIWGRVRRSLRGQALTPEQEGEALALCVAAARKLIKAGTVREDPYLTLLGDQQAMIDELAAKVRSDVLKLPAK